jgi:ABC-2 type transport system ATP-binding protein
MSDQGLELDDVTKRCGDFTPVREVSLTIPRGSLHGCFGANGAGKPTPNRMICDIIKSAMQWIRRAAA